MSCAPLEIVNILLLGIISISLGFLMYTVIGLCQGGRVEQYLKEEEENRNEENKKRQIESVDTEDGVRSKFQRTHTESMSEFQTSGELPLTQS